jgi:hypothetical protein
LFITRIYTAKVQQFFQTYIKKGLKDEGCFVDAGVRLNERAMLVGTNKSFATRRWLDSERQGADNAGLRAGTKAELLN